MHSAHHVTPEPQRPHRPAPAAFLGHGSPMNAIEQNRFTRKWRALGAAMERPRAILAISAHWETDGVAVTAMARPRTIHDFFGFPAELFAVRYPAPGDPALAAEVGALLAPAQVALDREQWGLDHGTWSVLVHAFPAANVPVVQLSLDRGLDFDGHVALGAKLAPLRERSVMVVGSGNVVHDLRSIAWERPDGGFDWARRFDEALRVVLTSDPASAPRLREHPDFARAVPTPEHFLPVLYLAGLAAAANEPLRVLVDGYAYGSLSMACYTLGAPRIAVDGNAEPAAPLPDPDVVPPERTNA
jgi:4,5-DOPA dioxygenase extradiol